jgi:hypothetical protein
MTASKVHELKGDALTLYLHDNNVKRLKKIERNQYLTWVVLAALFGGSMVFARVLGYA